MKNSALLSLLRGTDPTDRIMRCLFLMNLLLVWLLLSPTICNCVLFAVCGMLGVSAVSVILSVALTLGVLWMGIVVFARAIMRDMNAFAARNTGEML